MRQEHAAPGREFFALRENTAEDMGFGLLFVGYTLVLCMSGYGVLPAFIGYFVCMYACLKLSEYEEKFRWAGWTFGGVGAFSFAQSALQLTALLDGNTLFSDVVNRFQPIGELVFYIGQWMLLPALISITAETGRKKTLFACRRNSVLFVVMFFLYVVANVLLYTDWEYGRYCLIYTVISRFVVLLLNMISVFSCYMWICAEGQEEEEAAKESKLNESVTSFFKKEKKTSERNTKKKSGRGGRK